MNITLEPMRPMPLAILDAEHKDIRGVLDALSGMAEMIEGERRVLLPDLERMLGILDGFADGSHQAKEERVLFPALHPDSNPFAARVIQELEGDHLSLHKLSHAMHVAVRESRDGSDASALKRFAHAARLYVKVLDTHIDHETQTLFPLASTLLGKRELESVERGFLQMDRSEFGAGRPRFAGSIRALRVKYGH